jgi:hypothetical protein
MILRNIGITYHAQPISIKKSINKTYLTTPATIISLVLILCFLIAIFSCNASSRKISKAQNNITAAKADIVEAKADLAEANSAYLIEIENFKRETNEKIRANEAEIIVLKNKIALQKEEDKEKYTLKIMAFDKKNSELKTTLKTYKGEGKDNWNKFKAAFVKDMNALGDAFKNL